MRVTYLRTTIITEDVPKGGSDRPKEDVIVADCGEVCNETCIQLFYSLTLHDRLPLNLSSTRKEKRCLSVLSFKMSPPF